MQPVGLLLILGCSDHFLEGHQVPSPGARPGEGTHVEWLVAWLVGTAQKQRHGSVLLLSITQRMSIRCCVWCGFGHGPRPGSWQYVPWLWKLAFGAWTIAFLVGKELEVMEEVD